MPPWSGRDRRTYEYIRHAAEERGVDSGRANAIATRTVNKSRLEEGRTLTPPEADGGGAGGRSPSRNHAERRGGGAVPPGR